MSYRLRNLLLEDNIDDFAQKFLPPSMWGWFRDFSPEIGVRYRDEKQWVSWWLINALMGDDQKSLDIVFSGTAFTDKGVWKGSTLTNGEKLLPERALALLSVIRDLAGMWSRQRPMRDLARVMGVRDVIGLFAPVEKILLTASHGKLAGGLRWSSGIRSRGEANLMIQWRMSIPFSVFS